MPLRACMEAHTPLERDVMLRWIHDHYEEKELTHWYLQRIAFEVRCANESYRGRRITLDDVAMVFQDAPPPSQVPSSPIDKETVSRISQARWFALVGYDPKQKR